ncbi:MAG: PEP-CTERM sorting domain-containing protein [Planctomycetes bacterium]|nr:PEP-CTERM sorting domain-containing protein [Planctomycetota bacterium]
MLVAARSKFISIALILLSLGIAHESFGSIVHNTQYRYMRSEVYVAPPESGMIEENAEVVAFDFGPFSNVASVTMSNDGGSASANSDQNSTLGSSLIDATGSADASMFAEAFVEDEYGFGETHFEVEFEVLVAGDFQFDALALSSGSNFYSTDSYVIFKDLNGPMSFFVSANDPATSTLLSLPAGDYAIIAHSRVDVISNFDPEMQTSNASASFSVSLQAVPEPGTLCILSIGFVAMFRRRNWFTR